MLLMHHVILQGYGIRYFYMFKLFAFEQRFIGMGSYISMIENNNISDNAKNKMNKLMAEWKNLNVPNKFKKIKVVKNNREISLRLQKINKIRIALERVV